MNCKICDSRNIVIKENNLIFQSRYENFQFAECRDCDHILLLPPLSDSNAGQQYIRKNIDLSENVDPRILRKAKMIASLLPKDIVKIACDIGSGSCAFDIALEKLGWESYAVDTERFNSHYPRFMYINDLAEFVKNNTLGLIFSNHCFEHIELDSLFDLCSSIKVAITKGSVGLFIMPAQKIFLIKKNIYLEEFVFGHKNLFSNSSAKKFFEKIYPNELGFSVKIGYCRSRLSFLRTRLAFLLVLIKGLHLWKALILLGYVFKTLIYGSLEEVLITVSHEDL